MTVSSTLSVDVHDTIFVSIDPCITQSRVSEFFVKAATVVFLSHFVTKLQFLLEVLLIFVLELQMCTVLISIIPITVIRSPPCSSTDVLFSPDDRLVVTGISVKKNEGKGKLLFMDRESLEILTELEVSDSVRTKNKDLFIAEKVYLNIH